MADIGRERIDPDQARTAGTRIRWYERALPSLAGLEKVRVEKQLENMAIAPPVASRVKPVGAVPIGNVALAKNGTTVVGPTGHPEALIDGNSTNYDSGTGFAVSNWPCEWTITFAKAYQLQEIRFLLWNRDNRYFRYRVAVSADGKRFDMLADRSLGEWRGWQRLQFRSRSVKAIKLFGLYNSVNELFPVVELEAYCVPPATQLK